VVGLTDPLRVLYVNHTSRISGAERSLLDLLRGLPDEVRAAVACPEGDLASRVRDLDVPVYPITGTDGSLKLHWRHTPRALGELGRAALQVRRLAQASRTDLIHANSIRAGMVCGAGRHRDGPPVLVHVRDRLPPGAPSRVSLELIAHRSDRLVANSAYTAAGLPAAAAARIRVLANPVDLDRFDPDAMSRLDARRSLGLHDALPVLALVAQVTPWKGQEEAVRALALLRASGRDARLLVVGATKFLSASTRYDNAAYQRSLEASIDELGLRDRVVFTGERDDVPAVMRAADILLVPSWEEPFGRTVIEGMAMGMPVIATDVGGPAEIIRSGVDGFLVAPRRPELWAAALQPLIDDPASRVNVGARARVRARSFSLPAHVEAVLSVYTELQSA
jgi:glycosyltransferase involved in cell wall biosynthesis